MDEPLRRLLQAVHTVADLDLDAVLPALLEAGTDLVGARHGALGVLSPDGTQLVRFVQTGVDEAVHDAMAHLPQGRGALARLFTDGGPLRIDDVSTRLDPADEQPGHALEGSFLGAPVAFRGQVLGHLCFTAEAGGGFTDDDEDVAVAVAAVAAAAVSNTRLHEDAQRLAVYEDRDRIARDLHDQVVQRLFAVGLSLQAATSRLSSPEDDDVRGRLATAVVQLDETVLDIRSAVFALQPPITDGGLRRRLFDLVAETAGGASTSIRTTGPVDTVVIGALATDVLAVTREAVSNAVRHGGAGSLVVTIEVHDEVVVQVDDDGSGIDEGVARSGLAGLQQRAVLRGGSLSVRPRAAGGTRLRWRAPVRS